MVGHLSMDSEPSQETNAKVPKIVIKLKVKLPPPPDTTAKIIRTNVKHNIPKALRDGVFSKYCPDLNNAFCFVGCGEKITPFNFECGHVKSAHDEGLATLDNLRPICSRCRWIHGLKNMYDYIKECGFTPIDITQESHAASASAPASASSSQPILVPRLVDSPMHVVNESIKAISSVNKLKKESIDNEFLREAKILKYTKKIIKCWGKWYKDYTIRNRCHQMLLDLIAKMISIDP